MDASQLRSEISRLQRECSQLASENAAMAREINAVCNSARNAAAALTASCASASKTLTNSTGLIEYSDKTLHSVTLEQENISVLYRGFKNIETANKTIREITNKLYFEFSNFRMVRKIVRAFVDNMNLDIVKPEIIFKSIEKEHLQAPDFWLSCSMLAIMHWRADEKDAAERAIKQALELDERQTMLFFLSFNLLMGRTEAALKWFNCYRKIPKTGNDSNVILLLLHATNLREEAKDPVAAEIMAYLREEYNRSIGMNKREEIVEEVKNHLIQCGSVTKKFVFNNLRNYVKDYSVMASTLADAVDNAAILDFVETTNSASRAKGFVYIEKFIDELLDTPDKKEKAYTDEIEYNETIIRCVGDLAKAKEEFDKQHDYEEAPLNLMQECIDWLFGKRSAEFSEVARCNMFILCREIIADAAEKYFSEYRARMTFTHPVVIKDYSTKMDFKNKGQELRKVENFYENKKQNQLATVKDTASIILWVVAALAAIGGIVAFVSDIAALGIVALVAAAALGIVGVVKFIGNKKTRREIIKRNEAAAAAARAIVEKLFTEFDEYVAVYDESDRIAGDIEFAIAR